MKTMFVISMLTVISAFSQQPRPQVDSAVGIGNRIITHIADGGGWKTSIILMNLSLVKTASYTLNFYRNDGSPQQFSIEGVGGVTRLTGSLAVGGSVVIKTTGTSSSVTEGSGQFDSLATGDSIGGFAVFSNSNGSEAAVPFESTLSQNSILSFDNTNGLGMGVALTNGDFLPMTINATIKDGSGAILGTRQFTMQPNAHTSFVFTDQFPFSAGKQGTVYFECSDKFGPNAFGLAILGLRFTPQGAFTSVTAFEKWRLD